MPRYEFKAVAAPRKGKGGKGIKGREAKFANALEETMNELGAEGWDYVRTDMLPCEERSGLLGHTTTDVHMMIFRRALPEAQFERRPEAQQRGDFVHASGSAPRPSGADDDDVAPMDDAAKAGASSVQAQPNAQPQSQTRTPERRLDGASPSGGHAATGRAPQVAGADRSPPERPAGGAGPVAGDTNPSQGGSGRSS